MTACEHLYFNKQFAILENSLISECLSKSYLVLLAGGLLGFDQVLENTQTRQRYVLQHHGRLELHGQQEQAQHCGGRRKTS